MKKLKRHQTFHRFLFYAIQIGIALYVFFNWNDLDLKVLLLLMATLFWRSISNGLGNIRLILTSLVLAHHMAHPTAQEGYFSSEQCITPEFDQRAWELLRAKGRL